MTSAFTDSIGSVLFGTPSSSPASSALAIAEHVVDQMTFS
jgi:hypothetical protein